MAGVLSGIRVLDFGRYIAGPYCTALLGFLGAEIIRVEKLSGGEDRYIAPLFKREDGSDGEGAGFLQMNVNKKSVTLNPMKDEGREVVRRLVESADVVVANLPVEALKAMGLDYDSLKAIKPDIILTMVSMFGSDGPWKDKTGFDGVGQAVSGAMHMTGQPGEPVKALAPYVDVTTAMSAAYGTLAAIMHKQQTGEGQLVEATLHGSALTVFGGHLIEEAVLGLGREPSGNRVQTTGPSDVFQTKDGHVLIHVVGNGIFKRLVEAVGRPEWLEDPRFSSDSKRGDQRDYLCEEVGRWCAERTTDEAVDDFEKAGVPAGPVLNMQEALANPQIEAMGFMQELDYPGLPKAAPVPNMPVKLSQSEVGIRKRSPLLGENTDEVLGALGYTDEELEGFRQKRII